MSWETISLVGIVAGVVLGGLTLVGGFIVAMSFVRRIKARPAKGKKKIKQEAADEGYTRGEQTIIANVVERQAMLEVEVAKKLESFDSRLRAITRREQEAAGRGPRRGAGGEDPEWEQVDPNDPAVAAAIAAGEYVTPDGQPVADVEEGALPRQLPGTKEERLAHLRARGPVRR